MFDENKFKEILAEVIKPIMRESLEEAIKEKGLLSRDPEKLIFNFDEARKFLGDIPRGTLYALTSKNKIAHIKRGKRLFFKKGDLLQYLNEGEKI